MATPPTSRLQAGPGTRASGLRRRDDRSLFRNCCGYCAIPSSHYLCGTGPPTALVSLAAPPPASRLPSPPTLERLRRENTVITTTTAAVSVHNPSGEYVMKFDSAPPRLRK